MKPLLQVALILGLIMPAFSAAPDTDFDGKSQLIKNAASFLQETPADSMMMPVKPDTNTPEIVRKLERLDENGEFIEILPEIVFAETGKKVSYTVWPNRAYRWQASCPRNGSWSMEISYAWDTAAAGHEHYNPPPPSLRLSYSQSAQIPPNNTFSYIPSPITFPVMQGNNTRYYYWVWYPEFATREVQWTQASGACVSNLEDQVYVKEDVFVALTDAPNSGYVLTGMLTPHPYNHQATTTTLNALRKIAFEYKRQFPTALPLRYNDFSLPWGGLFDIGPRPGYPEWQFWNPPHSTHRRGWEADVEYENVLPVNYAKLNEIFIAAGARVVNEPDKAHWHLDFTPSTDKYYEKEPRCY